ncbi:MAG: hypothetical protein HUJ61_08430, partial [Bacilli bacterium]|nr:hypothetical protein [Bacilli bacterium]
VSKNNEEDVTFKFRVKKPIKNVFVKILLGEEEIFKALKVALIPSEMVMIKIPSEKLKDIKAESIKVVLEER